jgi:hypothetical protein
MSQTSFDLLGWGSFPHCALNNYSDFHITVQTLLSSQLNLLEIQIIYYQYINISAYVYLGIPTYDLRTLLIVHYLRPLGPRTSCSPSKNTPPDLQDHPTSPQIDPIPHHFRPNFVDHLAISRAEACGLYIHLSSILLKGTACTITCTSHF